MQVVQADGVKRVEEGGCVDAINKMESAGVKVLKPGQSTAGNVPKAAKSTSHAGIYAGVGVAVAGGIGAAVALSGRRKPVRRGQGSFCGSVRRTSASSWPESPPAVSREAYWARRSGEAAGFGLKGSFGVIETSGEAECRRRAIAMTPDSLSWIDWCSSEQNG